jgi:NADP-dependent 3-hydroxy acid dehydrogenase YdfG
MLLQNKEAVIYGGGITIGGAVVRAFVCEGVMVFLAGHTLSKLDRAATRYW